MKSRDRKLRHNRKYVLRIPALFSYHSSSTKCTIAYDVSSMATGCDVSESDVTGINVIRPKVGDYPWGVILIVRSVVWYSNGVFYHVRVLTGISTK